ncbi:glycoside hydrolase family 31 protein [Cesiribacter sp. SM1]|uniref:glycoside hydrolase family 31 protein n=1 Tax=Cesiribacter sp. SM1 TaxID=2861196 RepID=UPI001CD778A9|nr:glycoside hydrolase family 31 protein [Cesiribacter sp. SM1]
MLHKGLAQTISDTTTLTLLPGEHWWGGVVRDGHLMPFDSAYSIDLWANNQGNQIQPLLLSDKGRVIWSESPIKYAIASGTIKVASYGSEIKFAHPDRSRTLKDAFQYASQKYFPASGKLPHQLLFTKPQYNTWIELTYNQNQNDILTYANKIVENGLPAGVLMIDDNWQENYGKWQFHPGRFHDPKLMIDSLHQLGFKVMLWICPFVSADSDIYRALESKGYFINEVDTKLPLIVRWWNGASAVLDFTNPGAVRWFQEQLRSLSDTYNVDGFKFDAGDSYFYKDPLKSFKEVTPNEHTLLFQQFGLDYPLNEYRATWKMGGQPLVQRLHDKGHNWNDLQKLVPQIALQGILGYPFNCPDMIGGGEYGSFINLDAVDQELVVRSAQVHALMPMMQFSVAPWRVLDDRHFEIVKKAVEVRDQYLPVILDLVEKAAQNGEPVVRLMEYEFPGQGYHQIKDHFMLGRDILVAPVLQQGITTRAVVLPKGNWEWKGKTYKGGKTINIQVDLEDIPVFSRK